MFSVFIPRLVFSCVSTTVISSIGRTTVSQVPRTGMFPCSCRIVFKMVISCETCILVALGKCEFIPQRLHDCIHCEELRSASEFIVLPAGNGLWGNAS